MSFLFQKLNNFRKKTADFFAMKKLLSYFYTSLFVLSFSISIFPLETSAWGGRGHDTICEAAVFLVKEKELKKFLQSRPQVMGHLCNIPDTQWRNESGDVRAAGDPTHFIDPEMLGYTPKTMPLDLDKLKKEFTGKTNALDEKDVIHSVTRQVGSVYWRVDQFMRILAGLKADFSQSALPRGKQEEQNDSLAFNQAVYKFLTTAGILGHYVADTAQPWHNTADYDGFLSGHGGIHGYYENEIVSEMDGDLISKVLKKARSLKVPGIEKGTYLERMRNFSAIAFGEIDQIKKMDPIIKKSEYKNEKGLRIKADAERKPAQTVVKKFEPMILTQMARASVFLAQLWDEAYREAGKPDLKAYRSWKYPFKVDFIYPDYDDSIQTKKK